MDKSDIEQAIFDLLAGVANEDQDRVDNVSLPDVTEVTNGLRVTTDTGDVFQITVRRVK